MAFRNDEGKKSGSNTHFFYKQPSSSYKQLVLRFSADYNRTQ